MSGCLSLSSYKLNNKNNIVNEEHHSLNPLEKEGIVSILSSDFANSTTPKLSSPLNNNINTNKINSIRRTLSADMSSEKWVQNKGFPLKRVQSSEHLQTLGEEDHFISKEMNDNKGISSGGGAFEDIWSSILSEKKTVEAGSGDLAPYVHPLVKRASSLSEKSLEICTESLGSETGSDGFPSPLSDPGEGQEEEVHEHEEEVVTNNDEVIVEVVKYNFPVVNKKVNVGAQRSFPPPLPSLANRDCGSNLHMRTSRHDGRVVVEAVSVPNKNCFRVRRQDGRLLLTLTDEGDDQEEEEEEEDAVDYVTEEGNESLTLPPATGIVNVTRRPPEAVLMSKLIELAATWPRASNMTIVKSEEEEIKETKRKKVAHLLPPGRRMSTATATAGATVDAYEYYWRRSDIPMATAVAVLKLLAGKQNNLSDTVSPQVVKGTNKRTNKFLLENNGKVGAQEEVELVGEGGEGEKGEYLVPIFTTCKEPKRSLFFWEPYCIATS